jgi:hypothetical protein
MKTGIGSGSARPPNVTAITVRREPMPEEIVSGILRGPGYGVYAWEIEEATSTLWLSIRQTPRRRTTCAGLGDLGP